jgi:hypothetical protein
VVTDRARARTAAVAAALAAATDGEAAARQVATANGGEMRTYVARGSVVEVTVRVGQAEATSRATAGWTGPALGG